MVKSVRLSCLLQLAAMKFLSESKGLPGPRLWDVDPEVSCSPNVTCIVLTPNMNTSSLSQHMTSRA